MAKGEGRGWKKYVPSPVTIGKVFVATVVIHLVNQYAFPAIPENVRAKLYAVWPRI